MKHEDNFVVAWKYSCVQLAEHMPQLPTLLLTSIVEILTATSSSKIKLKENLAMPFVKKSLLHEQCGSSINLLLFRRRRYYLSYPTWANVQMHAIFPQDSLKVIAQMCMCSKMDQEPLVKLMSHPLPLVTNSSFCGVRNC